MSKLEQIEYILVGLIILLQFFTFFRTWQKMQIYRQIIPADFELSKESKPRLTYGNIHNDKNKYRATMMDSLDVYLHRTNQGTPDFNQVKDIVDRNTNVLEEEVSQTTSVPLYLGLMGTMIGVVVGLWNMNTISASINTNDAGNAMGDGINVLLGGVKIAMIASFTGILLTVINSSFLFNRARRHVESEKNRLYNFIQAKLLPGLSKGFMEGIQGIQNKMTEFTQHFGSNLGRLEELFNKNYHTLEIQKGILDALSVADVADYAQANVKILRELRQGTEQLQKFNQYLNQLTAFTGISQQFAASMEGMLNRTANIEDVLLNIDTHFSMSADLLNFLKSHFSQIQERGGLIQQALIKVDSVFDDSLNELKEHIQAKINAIKEFTIVENTELNKTLEQSRGGLGKLNLLEPIKDNIAQIAGRSNGLSREIENEFRRLNENLLQVLDELKTKSNNKSLVSKVWKKLIKKRNG